MSRIATTEIIWVLLFNFAPVAYAFAAASALVLVAWFVSEVTGGRRR